MLWSYQITTRGSAGETPFSLVVRLDAVVPIEIDLPTAQTGELNEEANNGGLLLKLNMLDGKMGAFHVKLAECQM